MDDNDLPPHLEAGRIYPVNYENGKVVTMVLKANFDRMERQLAAAERLYAATRDYLNAWEDTDELETNLKDALSDYANAKGE